MSEDTSELERQWEWDYEPSLELQHDRAKRMLLRAFRHEVDGFSEDLVIYLAYFHIQVNAFTDELRGGYIDPIQTHYEPLALPAMKAEVGRWKAEKLDPPPWLIMGRLEEDGNLDPTFEDAQEMTLEEMLPHEEDTVKEDLADEKDERDELRRKENLADERYTLRQTFAIHLGEMTNEEVEFLVGATDEAGTNRLGALLDELGFQIRSSLRRIA